MTDNEKELMFQAAYWRKKYSDCNPEVGFGPMDDSIVIDVATDSGVELNAADLIAITKRLSRAAKWR